MPELPEVETVRSGLASLVIGRSIAGASVLRDSAVRGQAGGAGPFGAALLGRTITAVARRGKFLWFELDEPGIVLSAHLGMSGQFRLLEADAEPHRHCRVRLRLDGAQGGALDFIDQRTFGYLHCEQTAHTPDGAAGGQGTERAAVPVSVVHIGRDVLDPALDQQAALGALTKGQRAIKAVLLDQTVVSGIGNIYADEALWLARVHPATPASRVGERGATALLAAVREVMARALEQGGTSFDALYVNVNGESGYFSRSLTAYGRAGEPCDRCSYPIERARQGGRSTHWCPQCQRTTS